VKQIDLILLLILNDHLFLGSTWLGLDLETGTKKHVF
jgi:hypothetical protein